MGTYNGCFEQKQVKYQNFYLKIFIFFFFFFFLVVKFSVYLNRRVFVMVKCIFSLVNEILISYTIFVVH